MELRFGSIIFWATGFQDMKMQEIPWETWIPGVLSKSQVLMLRDAGYLEGFSDNPKKYDYSAVDLHLSGEAYEFPTGSVKPAGGQYLVEATKHKLATHLTPIADAFDLQPRKTYLFKLKERLSYMIELAEGDFHGQATAKSSIGRLDVLARLIVDGANMYEGFTPDSLRKSSGTMFVEITPMTFPIRVREGYSLNQIRFFLGAPETVEVRGKTISKVLLPHSNVHDGTLSVDLTNTKIAGIDAAAFRSKDDHPNTPIDVGDTPGEKPKPEDYWERQPANENKRLQIQAGAFYIIRSHERITVPKGIAVYCRAIDETIGEMRIHYAGFVHPFFGVHRSDKLEGTPLIFEVRGHQVNVNLIHDEKMARLIFYRMSEDAVPEKKEEKSPYMDQSLQLSKYFGNWS